MGRSVMKLRLSLPILLLLFLSCAGLDCPASVHLKIATSETIAPVTEKLSSLFEVERAFYSTRVDFDIYIANSAAVTRVTVNGDTMLTTSLLTPFEAMNERFPDAVTLPFMAENFVVPFNLPKVDNITLSIPILSAIFRGEITHWNDSRITALSSIRDPSISGPIHACVRSDDSGETFVMTKAFRTADQEWTHGSFSEPNFTRNECCDSQNWPKGSIRYFGKGMTGVVGIVASIPGVITYTTHGVGERFGLQYVRLINARNKITPPTLDSLSRTMDYSYSRGGNTFVFDLMDSPFADAYPLASFEYIILPTMRFEKVDCCKVREMVGLVIHALTMPAEFYAFYNKAKLPKRMIDDLINFKISRITCDGENMYKEYLESTVAQAAYRTYVVVGSMASAIILTLAIAIVMIACNSYRKVSEEMRSWIFTADHMSISGSSSDTSIGRSFSDRCRSGVYQHNRILIKEMDAMHPSKWSRKTKKAVARWMKRINNQNVMAPLGFTHIERCLFSIWEFPGKGTLHYTIVSTKFELDFDIKLSIAMDVADGLQYLHQQGIVVGNLTCQTCYMDGGWTAKIGDWMDTSIYLEECPDVFASYFNPDQQFITMEDVNRVMYADPRCFSGRFDKKADIFSLGMLLHEIFTAVNNKDSTSVTPDMIQTVQRKIITQATHFPVTARAIPQEADILVGLCTGECVMITPGDAEQRPSPGYVYKELRQMRAHKKGIVDMLMENMENYMNQLEEKIQQRTADLAQQTTELQKVTAAMEGILFEVLPESVARQLINGTRVEPEYFESVTIFFSDVVGFTTISAQLLPAEVMDFLNELWLMFDNVASGFDVYKVDTIGDCYMIGSGLPKRNGTTHVKEVCAMSLHLLKTCPGLKVKKLNKSVSVRVGINSGPVIAGIVGTRMPQYCVFGDTVNTASRMESTSEPMRIQISTATANLLKGEYPGFRVAYRGVVEIKGKGKQETYWLSGEPPDEPDQHFEPKTVTTDQQTTGKPAVAVVSPVSVDTPAAVGVSPIKKGMFTAEKMKSLTIRK